MTQDLLTDLGEEQMIKNGLDGLSVTVGLYNDSTDALGDASDYADITTEPSNANYSAQTVSLTATDISGNWGVDNDAQFQFDFSDQTSTENVDTAYITYTFQAADTGDTATNQHLIANPALTQTRDIGSIDTLTVNAGDLEIRVD